MTRIFVSLVNFYQHTLSPDHSRWGKQRYPYGYCRFSPTCSEYAKQAVETRGLVRGLPTALWRVLRCNPFTAPAWDPVKTSVNPKDL